jgi:hypothetical protein
MTLIDPQCRVLAGGSFTATAVLTAVHTAMATSTKFDINLTAAGGAGDGFSLTSKTNVTPQLIFRRTGTNTVAVSIEPSGSVTVVGTTVAAPTGTSADWSGERIWTLAMSGSSRIMLSELDDALFLLTTSASHATFESSVHIGRIIEQDDAGDAALGRDGLGLMVGIPNHSTSGTVAWSTRSIVNNAIHVATNLWSFVYTTNITFTSIYGGQENAGLFGFFRPERHRDLLNSAASNLSMVVRWRYYRYSYSNTRTPRTVYWNDSVSDQAWMVLHTNLWCCPWDKTVVTV